MQVVVKGFGSIGKRHVLNLLKLGIRPYVITRYPDPKIKNIFWITLNDLKRKQDIKYAIISSCTGEHLDDIRKLTKANIKNFLIEKPIEKNSRRADAILKLSTKKKIKVCVAYNMRYLNCFHMISKFIKKNINSIKLVEVVAGQYLPEWKPFKDYRRSYNACRDKGGGVDLDLSHEIDYIIWLFGNSFKEKMIYRNKISELKIDSPDILKLLLIYKGFVVNITLDYLRRPKERYLKIFCENGQTLYHDFIKGDLKIGGKTVLKNDKMNDTYLRMIEGFMGIKKNNKKLLCSIRQSMDVLKVLGV